MLAKVPAGELIDQRRHEPGRRTAEVLCSDGSWRRVSVLAWASRRGGWAVLIRWPDGTEDWREYNRRNLRLALPLGYPWQSEAMLLEETGIPAGPCSAIRAGPHPSADPICPMVG